MTNFNYLVKVIDYGLITKNYPRTTKYYETTSSDYPDSQSPLPLIDIAQMLSSINFSLYTRQKTEEKLTDESNPEMIKLNKNVTIIDNLYLTIATVVTERGRALFELKENVGKEQYDNIINVIAENAGFKKSSSQHLSVIGGFYKVQYTRCKNNYSQLKNY